MILRRAVLLLLALASLSAAAEAQTGPRVAVLDFGATDAARRAGAQFAAGLFEGTQLRPVDSGQARAAARAVGYAGSLNLSAEEARDLGAAVDCDYFVAGDAQTVRRSSSSVPVYYEAYASVFVVGARTGRLVTWQRTHAEGPSPEEAERLLAAKLPHAGEAARLAILNAEREAAARVVGGRGQDVAGEEFEDAPEEGSAEAAGFRPPHPYRRLRPQYPETASQAEAEATVDVSVEIDERGEVAGARVVRWAGFGLDDAALETVRQLRFRPAERAGRAVPVRVVLRYNFRRPQGASRREAGEGEMRLGPALRALIRNDNLP